jgi:uncharacterized protein (UPF0264 family)
MQKSMRLLVSVRSAEEAAAAVDGGADLIDAKNPLAGALGAVSLDVLRAIARAVDGERPVTAALGDGFDEASLERLARGYASAGAGMVKVGFAGISMPTRVTALLAAARRGAGDRANVIAVAYADADRVGSAHPRAILEAAARAGVAGVLLDTADKTGPGLRGLIGPAALQTWVAAAHGAGLLVALAGKLTADDLDVARDAGADIVGVRGAACDDGRTGRVVAERVRALRRQAHRSRPAPAPDLAAACE